MTKFKPMLAPNEKVNLSEIKYPVLASTKLDGYRCIFYKGNILTRSLKEVQNKQLKEKFEELRKYSEENNLILDGEVYSHELTFQELNKFFMSEDLESDRSIKRYGEVLKVPDSVKFYIFDTIADDKFDMSFKNRVELAKDISSLFTNITVNVEQYLAYSAEEIEDMFGEVLEQGFEGLIIRSLDGRYKFGRGTIKEGLIFKVKPFLTFDAVIEEVIQGTLVDPNAERTTNELGRSVTSKKRGDRILTDRLSDFLVDYNGNKLKVSCSSMIHADREKYWKIKNELVGKTIEYKGMLVGAKDVPRHPIFIRFREDKDNN